MATEPSVGQQANGIAAVVAATPALAPWFDGTAAGTLWIAVSGGVDSTVLLHTLRGVEGAVAIHVDHGLHADAGRWRRHCAAVAAEFGVALRTERVRVENAGNREQAARKARYAAWKSLIEPGDVLALAHHADDQAETRLWQFLTGRHPGGMPAERRLGRGRLVRPLLGVRRRSIGSYAERHALSWVEDPSNADLGFDRNYIRHRLLPVIEDRFPRAVERLAAPRRAPRPSPEPLPVAAASKDRIAAWLLAAGLPLCRGAMAEIHRQSFAAEDRNPCVGVAPGIDARRYGNAWRLVRKGTGAAETELRAVTTDCEMQVPEGILAWCRAERGLPPGLPLSVARRRGGERIRPDGRGVTKTVKALFQERRIPPWQRQAWPLLFDADRLVAVPGLAIAADAAVAGGWRPDWRPKE